jgi:hypothetical protein
LLRATQIVSSHGAGWLYAIAQPDRRSSECE